jgi:hypothetical protein
MSSSHPLIADMGIHNPEDVPYFADLGRLFVVHARAEAAMHILARKLDPGAPDFSKERIKMLTARIRKTVGAAESADVNECLTQLKLISTERDKFAHRFVEYFRGKLQVSNEFSSKQFEKDVFTTQMLSDMMTDCGHICIRLLRAAGITWPLQQGILEQLHGPWLYTPEPK